MNIVQIFLCVKLVKKNPGNQCTLVAVFIFLTSHIYLQKIFTNLLILPDITNLDTNQLPFLQSSFTIFHLILRIPFFLTA